MMEFKVIKADIVNVAADAIVLPANSELKEGSGVSAALFSAAGRLKLTQACKKIGKCDVGSSVPTLAYNLKAKYIIHAVVPKWIDGVHNEYELLSSAYLSAMNIAEYMECESIAFPLLASGNNGFDLDLALEIAVKSIERFEGIHLKKLYLVIYGNRIAEIVREKGHFILDIPTDLDKLMLDAKHQVRAKELREECKETARKFMEDQIQGAFDYLKDGKHQKEIIEIAGQIVELAVKSVRLLKKHK